MLSAFAKTVSFARPNDTTGYTANDVVGAATASTAALTFNLCAAQGAGVVKIISTRLLIEATAVIASETSYFLHLYSETPPSALGDNAAFDVPAGDRAVYRGSLALGTPADIGSSLFIAVDNIQKALYLPTGYLYGYLVTTGGYTPTANRVFNISIVAEPANPLIVD